MRRAVVLGAAAGLGVAAALLRPVTAAAAAAPPTRQSPWGGGHDNAGQLGNGGTNDSAAPVRVSDLVGSVAISAGQDHRRALDGNGQVWGWGANNDGQLGDGTTTTRTTAVPATTAPGIATIAAGSWHSLALATTRSFTNTNSYDGMDRLTSGGIPGFPQGYSYDPVGNRLSLTRGPNLTASTYDKADRIQTVGSTPYTVDANGNGVARDQDSFADDQANRLISATVGGTTTTASGSTSGMREGRRDLLDPSRGGRARGGARPGAATAASRIGEAGLAGADRGSYLTGLAGERQSR